MDSTAITAQMAVIDVAELAVRLEELTARSILTPEQDRECQELLALVAQTTRMDSCEYFTPKLYRFDSLPQSLEQVVDEIEVTFYGVSYSVIATVGG